MCEGLLRAHDVDCCGLQECQVWVFALAPAHEGTGAPDKNLEPLKLVFLLPSEEMFEYEYFIMHRPQTLYVATAMAVLFVVLMGTLQLVRTGLPSANIVAEESAQRALIQISDFEPGQVEIVLLNNRRIIVWRRNEADKQLATSQNNPDTWLQQYSNVLGHSETVFADDANLTLDHEWFFALAEFPNRFSYVLLRTGDFDGFFEGRYAQHFDLSGRIRKGHSYENLTVINAEYSSDGLSIQLNLSGIPES